MSKISASFHLIFIKIIFYHQTNCFLILLIIISKKYLTNFMMSIFLFCFYQISIHIAILQLIFFSTKLYKCCSYQCSKFLNFHYLKIHLSYFCLNIYLLNYYDLKLLDLEVKFKISNSHHYSHQSYS
jgi:hypothetical protein